MLAEPKSIGFGRCTLSMAELRLSCKLRVSGCLHGVTYLVCAYFGVSCTLAAASISRIANDTVRGGGEA